MVDENPNRSPLEAEQGRTTEVLLRWIAALVWRLLFAPTKPGTILLVVFGVLAALAIAMLFVLLPTSYPK